MTRIAHAVAQGAEFGSLRDVDERLVDRDRDVVERVVVDRFGLGDGSAATGVVPAVGASAAAVGALTGDGMIVGSGAGPEPLARMIDGRSVGRAAGRAGRSPAESTRPRRAVARSADSWSTRTVARPVAER